tara:strand:+ start:381 stop:794 length:414 start_codon:yes stop_codon:yes gene_type:complete
MSTLVIDTIQGKTTAGSVNVRGEGSSNTNLQQGLLKVWVSWNTETAEDSFGVSSNVDNSTGNYRHNFTNNFANAHYAATTNTADFTHNGTSQNPRVSHIGSRGTSNVIVHQAYYNSSAVFIYYDGTDDTVQLSGDLT